jgi:enterochelin esterase-like enzyme
VAAARLPRRRRYPIIYLADGGGTSPGSLLTDLIEKGEIRPVIVVGVDSCPPDSDTSDCRARSYIVGRDGLVSEAFLAHERFLLETVIPGVEAQFGPPSERRLRDIGGASNGGVWTASMALRHPEVFGTAFVMSPGVPPAPHPEATPSTRFYVSAGLLERSFWWRAQCIAGDIVERGGTASLASYPSGHDPWMWGRILADNARDWLSPHRTAVVSAPPAPASCKAAGSTGAAAPRPGS